MNLFHLSDDEYIRRFDLAKLTEMHLEKLELVQPQSQADANKASLEFFRSVATGSVIKGFSWSQIKEREFYMKCYIHLFVRVCADLQPHSKQDWMDVCTLLVHDVPFKVVDTVVDAYNIKKARFRGQISNGAVSGPRQVFGETMTYSQRLPDQTADKAQWFVAYFKYLHSIERIEQLFVTRDDTMDKQSLLCSLSLLENSDNMGDKFTAAQIRMAVDRLVQCDFCTLIAELLYLVTEL
ncbi:Hypothetical protein GL50581_1788 [Giardia duodenalis ATCC 50581]|uniref:Uncharacterized protein n=1 Tax=Giardia intestinalis (strain ATCC 50581 / GS clone H7) TaxID=598745 RepID=C6LSP8_GIAIB|nr:Hypothetical protein GL50581_1788 [Giardia intestinalis ATCC 50581]